MYTDFDSSWHSYGWLLEAEETAHYREELVQTVAAPISQLMSVLGQIEHQKRQQVAQSKAAQNTRSSRQVHGATTQHSYQARSGAMSSQSTGGISQEVWVLIIATGLVFLLLASCAFIV